MNMEITVIMVSCVAILFSIYALIVVQELRGYISALRNAPVLREYVQKYIPIDNSEEAQLAAKKRVREASEEFEGMFAVGDAPRAKSRAVSPIMDDIRPEDLV